MNKSIPKVFAGIGVALVAVLAFLLLSSKTLRVVDAASTQMSAWVPVSSFQYPRRALTAVAVNGYLYVLGGINDNDAYVKEVEYARIKPDGTLGAWRTTATLVEGRFYLAAVGTNNYLYALGGATGPRGDDNQPIASVERARINADGSLEPWQLHNYLTTPRRGLKTVKYNNQIYAIGGYNGVFLKSVERATLQPDGSLGEWQLEKEASTIDRYIHSAAIFNNHIYLLGGHVRSAQKISYGDVEMTSIQADGTLLPWRIETSTLQIPRFIATAFAMNNQVYMLGGHDGKYRLDSAERAPIDAQGRVGDWSFATKLNVARSAAAVAVYSETVYVLGGMDEGALNSVEMAGRRRVGSQGINQPTK